MKKLISFLIFLFSINTFLFAQGVAVTREDRHYSNDSTVTGTAATGFTATGKYKTWKYKPSNVANSGPAINLDLKSTAGNYLEYLRMPSPIGSTSAPFSFICSPSLNIPDGSFNNVVSWGFNPLQVLDAGKVSIRFGIEPHWNDGGVIRREIHMPGITLPGDPGEIRLGSATFTDYGTKALSSNVWHWRGESFGLMSVQDHEYAGFSTNRGGNASSSYLVTPITGQGVQMGVSTTGFSFAPLGLSGDNSQVYFNSFQKVTVPGMQFSTPDGATLVTRDLIFTAPNKIIHGADYIVGNHSNSKKACFTETPGFSLHAWPGTATLSAIGPDASDASPSNLLFQLQKTVSPSLIDIITVRNDGKIFFSVSEYADNATAAAAGLTAGHIYRTGDTLKIVH